VDGWASVEPRRDGELRTRAFGWLMLAGGALGIVTVALPPAATGSDTAVLGLSVVSVLVGLALLTVRRELPEWALGTVMLSATALITFATHEGGPGETGTADNEMLYVWVCLCSFYFFALPHALGQLIAVGVAYALLLGDHGGIAFEDAATRWLVTMTTLLVAGLLIARLRDALHRLVAELGDRARLDSLTGLLNRRALEERAAVELARSRRDSTPVGILVADIDGFKALNDRLGHPAGDQVLLHVARALAEETRDVDAVARLGGDEFVVLLPGTTSTAALLIAERLRSTVERSASDARLRITLSIGVATGIGAAHGLEELWKAADRAMYEAKRAGGNRVGRADAEALDAARDEIPLMGY
jgi:diguanylate cyclase (GGDEF)-like protein